MRGRCVAFLYAVGRKGLTGGMSHAEGATSPVPLGRACVCLVLGTERRLVFLELSKCHRESQK